MRELASQVVHGVPIDLDPKDYLYWMSHGEELNAAIAQALRRPIIQFERTVTLPALGEFRPGDFLRVTSNDKRSTAEVVIGHINDDLRHFIQGRVEPEVVDEAILRIHRLCKNSANDPIIDALGGEAVVEVTLAQIWEMMKRQDHGQQGDLLTDGYANIFYIRDVNGILWAVCCDWLSDYGCWCVGAYSVAYPYSWVAGYQVFSRDSGS